MDRKTYIVVGLCLFLLVLWYVKVGSQTPPPSPSPPEPPETVEAEPQADEPTPPVPAPPKAEERPVAPEPLALPGMFRSFPRDPARDEVEATILSDRKMLDLAIDHRHGGIVRAILRQYLEYSAVDAEPEGFVELGSRRFPLASLLLPESAVERRVLESDATGLVLSSVYESGLETVEEWRFRADQEYMVDYRIELRNLSQLNLSLSELAVAGGGLRPDGNGDGGPRMQRVGMMDLGVDFLPAGEGRARRYNEKNIERLKEREKAELAATATEWLAVHNKYFMFFMRSPQGQPFSGVVFDRFEPGGEEENWIYGAVRLPPATLAAGEETEIHLEIYVGPKEYYRIRELGPGLTSVLGMDFFFFGRARWMGAVATGILRTLLWLRGIGLSYGLAIIVVTLIIKILFWPLTRKSTLSMRKMQKVQPLVKAIREKHKADPQTMNREIMALYREHKVNPLGGCLPMLCQIPIFFALFNTLRSAIELRQSSFLWVVDLSRPDTLAFMPFGLPIRPFALLMGASMMLQHKLTPTSADPNQAKMMMFMSFFFIFLFYSMPAGLTLYWTTNQVLTILQHAIIRHGENQKEAQE